MGKSSAINVKAVSDKLFRQIDRRLYVVPIDDPLSEEFILIYNCRQLKEYVDIVIEFAHEYDFPGCPQVNGYWSWVYAANNFASQVLETFSNKGIQKTLKDDHLIRSSLILISILDLLFRIRGDSIAQVNNRDLLMDTCFFSSLVEEAESRRKIGNVRRPSIDDGWRPLTPVRKAPLPPISPTTPSTSKLPPTDSPCIPKANETSEESLYDSGSGQKKTGSQDDGGQHSLTESQYYLDKVPHPSSQDFDNVDPCLSSSTSASSPSTNEASLFSLYESCVTEALLLYNHTIEDPSLRLTEKISLWTTFLSLLTDKGLPVEEVLSNSMNRVRQSLSTLTTGVLSNWLISAIHNNIVSIPFISERLFVTHKIIRICGSEWVVNSGQKKQVYRLSTENRKHYDLDYFHVSCLSTTSSLHPKKRKKLLIFCKESPLDNSFNLVSELAIPSIEVLCEQSDTNPFPTCLQKLLDLYVWIHSRASKKVLGFQPEDITFVGHGYGGRAILSLCLVIQEIRQIKRPSDHLPFPSRVVTIGSSFMTKKLMTPSSTFAFVRCMNGNLIESIESQAQMDLESLSSAVSWVPKATRRNTLSLRFNVDSLLRRKSMKKLDVGSGSTGSDLISLVTMAVVQADFMISVAKNSLSDLVTTVKEKMPLSSVIVPLLSLNPTASFRHLKSLLRRSSASTDKTSSKSPRDSDSDDDEYFYESYKNIECWRQGSCKNNLAQDASFKSLKEQLAKFNAVSSNPFISPLLYSDLGSLKSIDLHLITSKFSVELDDNVTLARCWKGKSSLHIIKDNIVDQFLHSVHGSKVLMNNHGHIKVIEILKASFE